jgi:formylmethanofuran dehydrogenase subunit E
MLIVNNSSSITQDKKSMKTEKMLAAGLAVMTLCSVQVVAHDEESATNLVQSMAGQNEWNMGRAPADWYAEIQRYHGHVGPWNVLGWRIGQAALRELRSEWGKHEMELVCYVPPQTPFTCLLDGLSVGTGNCQGRLDLRMAEVLTWEQAFVAVRRKDGSGGVIEFRPTFDYLKSIMGQPAEKLEVLCKECSQMPEQKLFQVAHVPSGTASPTNVESGGMSSAKP